MINFNEEFGYPTLPTDTLKYKYHRYRGKSDFRKSVYSRCNNYMLLWDDIDLIQFRDICKKCLSTFSAEEIEDLKYWLILKKLGVSV